MLIKLENGNYINSTRVWEYAIWPEITISNVYQIRAWFNYENYAIIKSGFVSAGEAKGYLQALLEKL